MLHSKTKFLTISPSTLLEYPLNNKIHTEESVDQIKVSIKKVGFMNPVEVDENMMILAGHGRVLASKELGLEKIPVLQYFDLSEDQKRFYRLSSNKTADFSIYNQANIQIELEELNDPELIKMFEDMKLNLFEDQYDVENEDSVPAINERVPVVQAGDLFQLGNHYLYCGDATKPESYQQLLGEEKVQIILTDPPYNVNYKGQGKKTSKGIKNDNMDANAFFAFLSDSFQNFGDFSDPNTPMYVFHSQKTQKTFEEALNQQGIQVISQLIWNKPSVNHVGADYKQKHEPFFYASKGKPERYGDIFQTTVIDTWENLTDTELLKIFKAQIQAEKEGLTTIWSVKRHNTQDYVHPTQKPVRIMEMALKNSSRSFDKVLDPFLGSGTTLIACEKSQRSCYAMELDPKYIEIIIARYRNFTKNKGRIKCLNRELKISKILDNTQ